jgi:spore germination protein
MKFFKRARVRLLAGLAGGVLLAGGGAWWLTASQEQPATAPATVPSKDAQDQPVFGPAVPGTGAASNPNTSKKSALTRAVLGYYTMFHPQDKKSEASLASYGSYLNQMATQTFTVTAIGSIEGKAPETGMKLAKDKQVQAFANITNQSKNAFDASLAHQLLADPKARGALVQNMRELVRQGGYKGINLDFELIPTGDRALYSQLVRETVDALHPLGCQLIVSVNAKTADSPKSKWGGAYDYKALGAAADRLQLMTYDENGMWGEPGPVASVPWMRNVLKYATSQVQADKLLLGLPAYGYDWNLSKGDTKGNKAVAWKGMPKLLADTGAKPEWDAKSQSPHLSYTAGDGSRHVVWYENDASIKAKTNLVKEYGLGGVAVWRMGLEDENFWKAVRSGLADS